MNLTASDACRRYQLHQGVLLIKSTSSLRAPLRRRCGDVDFGRLSSPPTSQNAASGLTESCPYPALSIPLEEREELGGPFGGLLEGRPVAAIVEQHEARVGDVVQNRDADLEGHHPVVAPVDQEDGRLDAGEVWR